MNQKATRLRFLLDENVPVSAGRALEDAGHDVIYFNDSGLEKGTVDPLVCLAADANDAILVAHDKDMKVLAKGHGITTARFKSLNLLQLGCRESESSRRLMEAISLIEHEWHAGNGRERRLHVFIGSNIIRSHR